MLSVLLPEVHEKIIYIMYICSICVHMCMHTHGYTFRKMIALNATTKSSNKTLQCFSIRAFVLLCAGTLFAYQSPSIWLNKCDKLCMKKCKWRMHKRPLKNAASLSLNKDVHSGSWNPILHSSKSLSKPCDHFVVYLYQSVEKLNRSDTSHMLIPFMFPGQKNRQHFFFWRNIYKYKYISTNNDAEGILSIDLLSDRINGGPITRRRAQHGPKMSSACRNEGWPARPPLSNPPAPHTPTHLDHWRQRRALLPIGSWVIDYQWIPDLTDLVHGVVNTGDECGSIGGLWSAPCRKEHINNKRNSFNQHLMQPSNDACVEVSRTLLWNSRKMVLLSVMLSNLHAPLWLCNKKLVSAGTS